MTRARVWLIAGGSGLLAAAAIAAAVLTADGPKQVGVEAVTPQPPQSASCAGAEPTVRDARDLAAALEGAEPGAVIVLADGVYDGEFTIATSGTAEQPITLCGSADSVLDGDGIDTGYVLYLDGVSNWVLDGFTVRNGQKGVMADGTTETVFRNLTVTSIGDEGIHLRAFSTDNTVEGNTVNQTGLRKPKFGEGIYIGTAESNWCDISDCEPDASDRNALLNNRISGTTAESIDIKEGTSDGVISGNTFDGSGLTEVDSWVDVKGNGWLIEGNVGANSPQDGFQTHEIVDGWGTGNVFRNNVARVNGPGFGFSLTPQRDNVVDCSNTVSGAGEGLSNVPCAN